MLGWNYSVFVSSQQNDINMWPLLFCFHLWVIESSRGKSCRRPTWNSQWQNKSEIAETNHLQINESDKSARSLSQQCSSLTGDVPLTGISCWLNAWMASGHGWLFGWVIWWCKLCCALWPGDQERSGRRSYHHVCMSFKMAIWKWKKTLSWTVHSICIQSNSPPPLTQMTSSSSNILQAPSFLSLAEETAWV